MTKGGGSAENVKCHMAEYRIKFGAMKNRL